MYMLSKLSKIALIIVPNHVLHVLAPHLIEIRKSDVPYDADFTSLWQLSVSRQWIPAAGTALSIAHT